MQAVSEAYEEAIVASYRRILPRAIADIVDPDIIYGSVDSSGQAYFSRPDQIYDKQFDQLSKYATLETDRFMLDESFVLYPDAPEQIPDEHGYLGDVMSLEDGTFPSNQYVQLNVQNLSVLQAAAVHFSDFSCDGVGENFTIEIYSGETITYTKGITGNRKKAVFFEGFTAKNVTAIRVIFSKWSLANRRVRIIEIVPGIYENWGGEAIYSVDVLQETAFDCMSVPYGTCTLQVYNENKRFNPYNQRGLFQSIEERQGIAVSCGVQFPNGAAEFLPLGIYYQQSGGWETDAYGLTITFKLVDIIGLLAKRDFNVPSALPTTLEGWIAALVAHLGSNFQGRYRINDSLATASLITDADNLKNLTCGHILRYACMATGSCFRANPISGELEVITIPGAGGSTITADNMSRYPKTKASDSIAQIAFRLADSERTEYIVNGTLAAADKSLNISNPFIHTKEQADIVAANILQFYGHTLFTVTGRGDMRCELGDIDTVDTGFGLTATGRRYKQQFKISNGIMKNVPSYLMEI